MIQKEHDDKRFASKLQTKSYAFDFSGKRVVEDAGFTNYDKILQDVGNIEKEDYLKPAADIVNRNIQIDAPKVSFF